MDRGNDNLVKLQMRQVFLHYGGAFYQNGGFINRRFIIYYSGAGLAIIAVAKMRSLAGIMLNDYIVPVTYQYPHGFRRKSNTVFLKGCFFRNTNMQLCPFGFNIQSFLKC